MVLVGQSIHDGHIIQAYRVPSNQPGYVATDGNTYQFHIDRLDRTSKVVVSLNKRRDGSWQDAAKDVINAENPASSVTFTMGETIAESNSQVSDKVVKALMKGEDPAKVEDNY